MDTVIALFEELKTDSEFFQSVRLSLGISDEGVLTDEFILNPIFYSMAVLILEELLPCLEEMELTSADLLKLKLAFAMILASLVAPSITGMVDYEVKTIDVTWKRKVLNYDDLAIALLDRAKDLLDDFECYAGDGIGDTLFTIAPSKRAVNCNEL